MAFCIVDRLSCTVASVGFHGDIGGYKDAMGGCYGVLGGCYGILGGC